MGSMIQSISQLIEVLKEKRMALSKQDAKTLCRQQCRLLLGDELFCNDKYEHVEICWEIESIYEFFVGVDGKEPEEGVFPVYMDEDDSPFYVYVFCDRKTGWLEYGALRRRGQKKSGEFEIEEKDWHVGGIGRKYLRLKEQGVERRICLESRRYNKVNVRNANGGLNTEKIEKFFSGFERGIEKGRVPMFALARMTDMDEEQLESIYSTRKTISKR